MVATEGMIDGSLVGVTEGGTTVGCDVVGVALETNVGKTVLVIVGAIDEGSSDGGDEG